MEQEPAYKRGKVTAYFPYDALLTDEERDVLQAELGIHLTGECAECNLRTTPFDLCERGDEVFYSLLHDQLHRDGN